jgi:glycerophosphoryl diester phosphodiesterase
MYLIPDNIISIAHRGYSLNSLDNSLGAFREAIELGFDMIELDIQFCKSNDIIVFHDSYIDNKFIKDMTLEEIRAYVPNVLTLYDFFQNIDINKVKINIDIKGNVEIIDPLIDLLTENVINLDNIIITSFNLNHLKLIGERIIVKKGLITENIFDTSRLVNILNNIQYLVISWSMLDEKTIKYAHSLGIKVFAYTVKNEMILNHILKYKVDGIVSDCKLVRSFI